mgnify:CR=1 FL=1
MNNRVLFVDDESNVLDAIKRAIRKDCNVHIAVGPEEGLAKIANEDTFALIVSDMRMPGMDGVEFLRAAKQLSPDSVRMMLTGNSDQQTAVSAVNDGEVYRYLTKPCDVQGLRQAVAQGLQQYALITAEKTLLEETLIGSIEVLTDLLSLARPDVFGRTGKIQSRVDELLQAIPELSNKDHWTIQTAVLLSQIGCVSLRAGTLAKINSGVPLEDEERRVYFATADRAAEQLERIPRLEAVAETIRYQHKHYSGAGWPEDSIRAESIPMGARALHLVASEEALRARGYDRDERIEELKRRSSEFDPRLLSRLVEGVSAATPAEVTEVSAAELEVGMKIAEDVLSTSGSLLVCAGQGVTTAVIEHLLEFHQSGALDQPIQVTGAPAPAAAVVNG